MKERIRALLPPRAQQLIAGEGLKAKAARGGAWLAVASGLDQGFRFVRNMILTRLLAPEAFGLMAIVLAVNTFFESFSDVGIDTAVVQNPRSEERPYLNAAWWISFVRALGLYAVIFVAAPFVGEFYRQPSLATLMRVAFLSTVFRGTVSPKTWVMHKRMDFKRLMFVNQGAGICGTAAVIISALWMRNVWALVLGFTLEAAIRCVLSYAICPFRPGFEFHKQPLLELYKYSRGMFGLPILTFIFLRADVFVIGRVCSAADLGIYSMAAALGALPYALLGTWMTQLVVPAFSHVQDDNERIKRMLSKITSAVVPLMMPALAYVALYGGELLRVVYGPRYMAAGAAFGILFAVATVRVVNAPVAAVYFMTGRPELNRFYTVVRTVIIVVLLYPATKWFGLAGAAGSALIAMSVGSAIQIVRLRRLVGLRSSEYVADILPALRYGAPVCVAWAITFFIPGLPHFAALGIGLVAVVFAYGLAGWERLRQPMQPVVAGGVPSEPVMSGKGSAT